MRLVNIIVALSHLSRDLGDISMTPCKLSRIQASDISNRELLIAIETWPALDVSFEILSELGYPSMRRFRVSLNTALLILLI
jgi:hypothetical protein